MLGCLWLLWLVLPVLGLPFAAVGATLWLYERASEKPLGSTGSLRLLAVGMVLCLPLLIYLGPALLEILHEAAERLVR